jgi:hypothetical protein
VQYPPAEKERNAGKEYGQEKHGLSYSVKVIYLKILTIFVG